MSGVPEVKYDSALRNGSPAVVIKLVNTPVIALMRTVVRLIDVDFGCTGVRVGNVDSVTECG